MTDPAVALTIAGSDPSGGAGIQADLATFGAHGVHACSALTAVTAQNTLGVQAVTVLDPEVVDQQIESVVSDLAVAAVKTGMLADEAIVRLVGRRAEIGHLPNLVVDPVMVSSTGDRLLTEGAESAYREALLPWASVVTPNLREASVLLGGVPLITADDVLAHADQLQALCPEGWIVVTGGHVPGEEAVDIVLHRGDLVRLPAAWVETENDHGTGCTFASATAARLARGETALEAIRGAKSFVLGQIRRSADWTIGSGRGPVAHLPPPDSVYGQYI